MRTRPERDFSATRHGSLRTKLDPIEVRKIVSDRCGKEAEGNVGEAKGAGQHRISGGRARMHGAFKIGTICNADVYMKSRDAIDIIAISVS